MVLFSASEFVSPIELLIVSLKVWPNCLMGTHVSARGNICAWQTTLRTSSISVNADFWPCVRFCNFKLSNMLSKRGFKDLEIRALTLYAETKWWDVFSIMSFLNKRCNVDRMNEMTPQSRIAWSLVLWIRQDMLQRPSLGIHSLNASAMILYSTKNI